MVDGMDRGAMIQTLNNALLMYEASKNGAPVAADTPIKRLEAAATKLMADMQDLIVAIDTNGKRWGASGVTALIAGTEDGAVVAGGTFEKERWLELQGAYLSFLTWLATPMAEGAPTPINVIFRDYVPPAPTEG